MLLIVLLFQYDIIIFTINNFIYKILFIKNILNINIKKLKISIIVINIEYYSMNNIKNDNVINNIII